MNLPFSIPPSPRATVCFAQPTGPGLAVPLDASPTRFTASEMLLRRPTRSRCQAWGLVASSDEAPTDHAWDLGLSTVARAGGLVPL